MVDFNSQFIWTEIYRPSKIEDCILPSRIKTIFEHMVETKQIPNLLLFGTPGVGKTTVAKALCKQADVDFIMINGSEDRGIDVLRGQIKGFASSVSLSKARKAVIIDEADYLTPVAQAAFRGLIEEFSVNCTFIFTCNSKDRIIDAIHSRCMVVDFKLNPEEKPEMATLLLKRLKYILDENKVVYDGKILQKLIIKLFPDYRKIINEVQKHSAKSLIDSSILLDISDESVMDLIQFMKSKSYKDVRAWVAKNVGTTDAQLIMRFIYDKASTLMNPVSIPAAILVISKYQFQSSFVQDQEINLMAMLTELMLEVEFK